MHKTTLSMVNFQDISCKVTFVAYVMSEWVPENLKPCVMMAEALQCHLVLAWFLTTDTQENLVQC